MKVKGSARAGTNAFVANFSRKTTVVGSGASTLSTIVYQLWRGLSTPCGGWMMCSQLAATSAAVRGEPSWNFDAVADLKGIGLAVIGRLRHRGAKVADDIGGRGRVFRVDPDQHAVKGRHRACRK